MRVIYRYTIILFALLLAFEASAQSYSDKLKKAQALHNNYDFDGAIAIYNSVLEGVTDSTERNSIIGMMARSENGRNLLQYIATPKVIASVTVPRRSFYLSYGHLKDKSWIPMPNAFVQDEGIPLYDAIYYNGKQTFFSAPDDKGVWNLRSSSLLDDGKWSAPAQLDSKLSSPEDEILPLLSDDGKSLYFSSKGLFGMGGYDIFVSRWNEETKSWGEPENLGFPFSSPYDDLLYSDTPDGNFTIFASNRDCARDSITIYVLAFENSPIRRAATSLDEIRSIAHLTPNKDKPIKDDSLDKENDLPSDDPLYKQYADLVIKQRAMNDTLLTLQQEMDKDRELYSSLPESDRPALLKAIRKTEEESMDLQMRIGLVSDVLQEMSMDLLMKGINANPEDITAPKAPMEKADTERPAYKFSRNLFGSLGDIEVMEPEAKIDYSFRILDEAMIVDDNTLPKGIVYQIRMMVSSSKVSRKQLKGLSPVFEVRQPTGKYIYSVGLFTDYAEAQSKLPKVKGKGFSSAYIVAYNDGKNITTAQARQLEKAQLTNEKYRIVISGYGETLPDGVMKIISDNCSKDIMKSVEDGETIFVIAPFTGSKDADTLATTLKDNGISGVSVQKAE